MNGQKRNNKRGSRQGRGERVKSEFDQEIISIRRVTRVVKGGKRFSFSVAMALGNRRGKVGLGSGKAADVSTAIEKGVRAARKQMIVVPLTKSSSIPHEVKVKFGGARLLLKASPGRGVVAGSVARMILRLCGVRDVSAKILSKSKNKLNNAKATLLALARLKPVR